MNEIVHKLDERLKSLDAATAGVLEQAVRTALENTAGLPAGGERHPPRYLPPDFFAKISAEFGPEPFERSAQGVSEMRPPW